MKGGGGWWWEEKAREGSGEEEVNPTLPLARSAWCGAGWRVQSRAGSLASLSSKSYASPSICDSAKKTSVLWSDVASSGKCAVDSVGRLDSSDRTSDAVIRRLGYRVMRIFLRLEAYVTACCFSAKRSLTCFSIFFVAAALP